MFIQYTHKSFVFHHCQINFVHIWLEELQVIHHCHIFQNLSLGARGSTHRLQDWIQEEQQKEVKVST